ncbi:MAG: adenylate/guanylate cyclase domain-containing protein [Ginsengibacter sp.]
MESDKVHQVAFLGEKLVPISEDETILHASLKAGIPHYHACGGNAKCSTCRVLVLDGMENLSEINEKEYALRKRILLPKNVRLACQTHVTGEPVLLKRIIRDKTDIHLYVHRIDEEERHQIGEEKELALFFLDIRDFTPFMEKSLPFDVIHIISRLYLLFEKVIKRFKGEIIETAGDGLYAVFGFETTLEDAASNAYHAATNIFKELRDFNKDYLDPYFSHPVNVGIGIHAGKVIMGSIEVNKKDQLKIMGFPVNIAARLQGATRELNNNFIVSSYFYSLIKCEPVAGKVRISLKGISEGQEVYLLGAPFIDDTY